MTEPMPAEPHENVKADNNPETRSLERDQSSYVARGGQSSGVISDGPEPGDEQPSRAKSGGTAGGDPLSGATADADDVAGAVSGDTGPEHPGQHG